MSMMYYPDGTNDLVRSLVQVSREFGSKGEYVLAGGGNTSVKEGDDLYVKASGTQLASIDADGFVQLSRRALDAIWEKQYPQDPDQREDTVLADMMAARSIPGDTRRPSVECLLHNLFPYKLVVHTHPPLVNGLTCSRENENALRRLLGDDIVWLPVIDPGYTLAAAVKKAIGKQLEKSGMFPRILMLQNHGIFVAADSEAEIRKLYDQVFDALESELKQKPDVSCQYLQGDAAAEVVKQCSQAVPGSHCKCFTNNDLQDFLQGRQHFAELELSVTPDHIVYCGYRPLFVESVNEIPEAVKAFRSKEGFDPRIIAVQGVGVVALHQSEGKADLARQLFLDNVKIAVYARSFGGIQFMPEENINFIRTWEAEKYRAGQSK